jgi:two-component system aerobic respiration control protein ArcA
MKRKRILIVDDQVFIRRMLEDFFQLMDADAELASAADGVEALNTAREFNPDLVVLDVDMPGKNGIEVCETLRQTAGGEKIGVLAISGNASEDRLKKLIRAGADAFLPKPFNLAAFTASVADVTRKRTSGYGFAS